MNDPQRDEKQGAPDRESEIPRFGERLEGVARELPVDLVVDLVVEEAEAGNWDSIRWRVPLVGSSTLFRLLRSSTRASRPMSPPGKKMGSTT
jgi:hypothetical protein